MFRLAHPVKTGDHDAMGEVRRIANRHALAARYKLMPG
jgi:hypothetical protein